MKKVKEKKGRIDRRDVERRLKKTPVKVENKPNTAVMEQRYRKVALMRADGKTASEIQQGLYELGVTGNDGGPLGMKQVEIYMARSREMLSTSMPSKLDVAYKCMEKIDKIHDAAEKKGDFHAQLKAVQLLMRLFGIDQESVIRNNVQVKVSLKDLEESHGEYEKKMEEIDKSYK